VKVDLQENLGSMFSVITTYTGMEGIRNEAAFSGSDQGKQ
jgi:hypothetical protein